MALLMKKISEFFRDERGQSTTEYILILAVVVMIAIKFKDVILGQMQSATEKLGTQIESSLDSTFNSN